MEVARKIAAKAVARQSQVGSDPSRPGKRKATVAVAAAARPSKYQAAGAGRQTYSRALVDTKIAFYPEGTSKLYLSVEEAEKLRDFVSEVLILFCSQNGITYHLTIPHSPSNNPVAERFNRTICEKARSLLITEELILGTSIII